MYPYLYHSGSLTIGSYGVMLAIAYLVGRWYFLRNLSKTKANMAHTELLIIFLLVSGVVGAKLMFVLKNPDKADLLLSGTGFSSQGAILGALVTTYIFTRVYKLKLSILLDAAAPAAILAYGIARIGCFLSGDDCYGIPTNVPWAMTFPNGIAKTNELVHPLPLYEVTYSIAIFLFLNLRQKTSLKPYEQFFSMVGLWGAARFMIEFWSTNTKLIGFMSGSQFGALLMFIGSCIYFLHYKSKLK